MTHAEFILAKQQLDERMLALASAMAQSDAHALKCHKLGLEFSKEYPEEFEAYKVARDEYNEVEANLQSLITAGYEEPLGEIPEAIE